MVGLRADATMTAQQSNATENIQRRTARTENLMTPTSHNEANKANDFSMKMSIAKDKSVNAGRFDPLELLDRKREQKFNSSKQRQDLAKISHETKSMRDFQLVKERTHSNY